MKEIHNEIEAWLDRNPDGWASKEKVTALVGAVFGLRPQLIVEIGVWTGRSLIPMAMAMRHMKSSGKIVGIDPWKNEASIYEMDGEDLDFWKSVNHEHYYQLFLKEVEVAHIKPWIEIARCRSDEFELSALTSPIDLLHVDGNHGEEASVHDVTHFAPHVRVGGLFYMDDVDWASKASKMIPSLGFQKLYAIDTGIMFQKVKL